MPPNDGPLAEGYYVTPTVITRANNDWRVAREEIFGPVVVVHSFRDEEEALQIANSVEYGLAASVWTSNLNRAHRVAQKLQAGSVSVNTMDALDCATPFGGFKQSGFGRDKSLEALGQYTQSKLTLIEIK